MLRGVLGTPGGVPALGGSRGAGGGPRLGRAMAEAGSGGAARPLGPPRPASIAGGRSPEPGGGAGQPPGGAGVRPGAVEGGRGWGGDGCRRTGPGLGPSRWARAWGGGGECAPRGWRGSPGLSEALARRPAEGVGALFCFILLI